MRIIIIILAIIAPLEVFAGGLIRDAEIEATLREMADPIFEQAGLNPKNVRIFIVQDDNINAFVAGGANIFIHTGLINAMETPDMLMGVIAHETGHITGGHLARGAEQLEDAQIGMIVGYILGAAAAAGAGGEAGAAVISGSGNIANRLILSFTRANEQAADQAALNTLDALKISASGMLKTFEILRRKEQNFKNIDPYGITHPLSSERIAYVRAHVNASIIPEGNYPKELSEKFARMQAKLYAFMNIPPKTLAKYPETVKSTAARMARAIAWYKKPDAPRAISLINDIIKENPEDEFLYDLKGQIAFENSLIDEAMKSFEKASTLAPENALILASYGEALLAKKSNEFDKKAEEVLIKSTAIDNENPRSWRLLATAYGKLGKKGEAKIAIAEEAVLSGDSEMAIKNINQALSIISKSSVLRIKAEDLKLQAERMKEKNKE